MSHGYDTVTAFHTGDILCDIYEVSGDRFQVSGDRFFRRFQISDMSDDFSLSNLTDSSSRIPPGLTQRVSYKEIYDCDRIGQTLSIYLFSF